MKAEEYLKQSGYNEKYPIGEKQIIRLMEGYSISNQKAIEKAKTSIKGEMKVLSELTEFHRGKKFGLQRALQFITAKYK